MLWTVGSVLQDLNVKKTSEWMISRRKRNFWTDALLLFYALFGVKLSISKIQQLVTPETTNLLWIYSKKQIWNVQFRKTNTPKVYLFILCMYQWQLLNRFQILAKLWPKSQNHCKDIFTSAMNLLGQIFRPCPCQFQWKVKYKEAIEF